MVRLDGNDIKAIDKVANDSNSTTAAVLRAAVQIGLPVLILDPSLVRQLDSGTITGRAVIDRIISRGITKAEELQDIYNKAASKSSLKPTEDEFANLPGPGSMGPQLEDLVAGKDEWYYIRGLHRRLKKLEEQSEAIKVRDPQYGVVDTHLPKLHWEPICRLAKLKGISRLDAFKLMRETGLRLSGGSESIAGSEYQGDNDIIGQSALSDYLNAADLYGKQIGVTMEDAIEVFYAESVKSSVATSALQSPTSKVSKKHKKAKESAQPKRRASG